MSSIFGNVPTNVTWHKSLVTPNQREFMNGHRGAVIWLTGLSGSGKSSLAYSLESKLHSQGYQVTVLDGDNVRFGLCSDLGFDQNERKENIRRVGEVARLFVNAGMIVIAAFISPYQRDRNFVRGLFNEGQFAEVYCNASIEICEARDVKGLYKKSRDGEIKEFTGISAPYEEPLASDLILNTGENTLEECVLRLNDLVLRIVALEN